MLARASIVVDPGVRRYRAHKCATAGIDLENMKAIGLGSCSELRPEVLKRHFEADPPADPARDVFPRGHMQEFALVQVE